MEKYQAQQQANEIAFLVYTAKSMAAQASQAAFRLFYQDIGKPSQDIDNIIDNLSDIKQRLEQVEVSIRKQVENAYT